MYTELLDYGYHMHYVIENSWCQGNYGSKFLSLRTLSESEDAT